MKKILVVDDDLVSRTLISHIVTSQGYECVEAEGGMQAIEKFSSEEFVLVTCDQEMPDMKGLEVLKEIRQTSDVPFILLTGYAELSDISAGDHELNNHLTKPVSSKELKTCLRQILGSEVTEMSEA